MARLRSLEGARPRVSGAKIAERRENLRVTQHDLASALRKRGFGTTQVTVSRWENGQQPHAPVLPALAAELGCAIDELYADEEDDPSLSPSPEAREFASALEALFGRIIDARLKATA